MDEHKTFKYFGYGSNMLTERIHINNPTATFLSIGTLKKFRFGFEQSVRLPEHFGAIATIRHGTDDDFVVGCVWAIDSDQVANLDRQEGHYNPCEVDVELADGSIACCRTYEMHMDVHPGVIKPHPFYKKICAEGARQHNFPEDYIKFLESFEDTNEPRREGFYDALVPVMENIDRMKA